MRRLFEMLRKCCTVLYVGMYMGSTPANNTTARRYLLHSTHSHVTIRRGSALLAYCAHSKNHNTHALLFYLEYVLVCSFCSVMRDREKAIIKKNITIKPTIHQSSHGAAPIPPPPSDPAATQNTKNDVVFHPPPPRPPRQQQHHHRRRRREYY